MSSTMTLYHCWQARSFRALWMLEELGLPYRLEMLPFPPRALAPEYLQINPLGTIPLLLDGPVRMTESAAICHYLVSRHGPTALNVAADEAEYGAFLNWLSFGEATLTFPQTLVLRYSRFEPRERRQPQVADDYARWFLARLRAVDAALASGPFLCGDRFTAADISVGYAVMLTRYTGLSQYLPVNVSDYLARLEARSGYLAARAAEDAAADRLGIARMTKARPFELAERK